jgi:hypothetical protein
MNLRSRGIELCRTLAIAVLIICSQTAAAQLGTKITVINLRDHGWETPEPIHPHEANTVVRRSIVIDHEGRVLVGFVVRARTGVVTREQPALAYRILRFTPDHNLNLCQAMDGGRIASIYPIPTRSSPEPMTNFRF